MARIQSLYCLILALLSSLASAQLVAELTSAGNPPIISAKITNTSPHNLTLLAANNIFDTKQNSSKIFHLADASSGQTLLRGGTHIFYSGMTDEHTLCIKAGETFTRQFDVLSHLNVEAADAGDLDITVSLPGTFRGISGSACPAPVAPDTDYEVISLQSESITVHTVVPERVEKRYKLGNGLQLIMGGCTAAQRPAIVNARNDVVNLSAAGQAAAEDATSKVFQYFFPPSVHAQVQGGLANIWWAARGYGPEATVQCYDFYKTWCEPGVYAYAFNAATQAPGSDADGIIYPTVDTIVLCPTFHGLPVMGAQCHDSQAQPYGYPNKAHVLLHETTHIDNIMLQTVPIRDGEMTYGDVQCHNLTGTDIPQTTVADCWTYMSTWAWYCGYTSDSGTCIDEEFNPSPYDQGSLVDAPGN